MAAISNLTTPVHLRYDNPNAARTWFPPTGQAFQLFDGAMPFNTSDVPSVKINKIQEAIRQAVYVNIVQATVQTLQFTKALGENLMPQDLNFGSLWTTVDKNEN